MRKLIIQARNLTKKEGRSNHLDEFQIVSSAQSLTSVHVSTFLSILLKISSYPPKNKVFFFIIQRMKVRTILYPHQPQPGMITQFQ